MVSHRVHAFSKSHIPCLRLFQNQCTAGERRPMDTASAGQGRSVPREAPLDAVGGWTPPRVLDVEVQSTPTAGVGV